MKWVVLNFFFGVGVIGNINSRDIPITVKSFVNKTVELPCQVENSGDPTRVRWWKEAVLLADSSNPDVVPPNRVSMNKWNLKIDDVRPEDTGEYVCKASRVTTWGDVTQVYAIQVLYPPSVTTIPESGELEVNLGDEVNMTCIAKGVPTPVITWNTNGKELKLIDERPSLRFRASDLGLAGQYTCIANNSIGDPVSANIDLKIRYKPRISAVHPWVHAAPGIRAQLECKVQSWPEAHVDWYFNDKKIDYNVRKLPRQNSDLDLASLTIKKVRETDYGMYVCQASNPAGVDRAEIQLSGAPKPVTFKNESKAISPTTYNFIWEVDSYSPISNCFFMFRENTDGNWEEWHRLYVPGRKDSNGPLHTESFNLTGLNEYSIYEATIQCQNRYGISEPTGMVQFSTSRIYADSDDRFSLTHGGEDNYGVQLATLSQKSENHANGQLQQNVIMSKLCLIVPILLLKRFSIY